MGSETKIVPTTQTQQGSTQLPAWFDAAGQNAVGIAQGIANKPYQGYTGPMVAGLSPNTSDAISLARGSAGTGLDAINMGLDATAEATDLAHANVGTGSGALAMAGQNFATAGTGANDNANAGQGDAGIQSSLARLAGDKASATTDPMAGDLGSARNYTSGSAAPITASDIASYFNPYVTQALDPARTQIERESAKTGNTISAKAAMSGAYGGSRQSILEGENGRNLNESVRNLYQTGYSDAFDKASGMASDAKGREASAAGLALQTGGLANTGANDAISRLTQASGASGAAAGTKSNLASESVNRSLAAGTAQQGLAQGQEQAANADQDRLLSTVNPALAGASAQLQNVQSSIQQLLQTGAIDQTQAQNEIDTAYQQYLDQRDWSTNQLNALIATLSGVPYGTTTNVTTKGQQVVSNPSMLGQLAGGAMTAASIFGGSNEEAKEDIKDVDEEDVLKRIVRLPIKSYRYKAEFRDGIGDDGRTRIGPMAQAWGEEFDNNPGAKVIPMPQMNGAILASIVALERRTRKLAA